MTKIRNLITVLTILTSVIVLLAVSGCTKDEEPATIPPITSTYNLMVEDVLGVTGEATFTETNSTIATIDIALIDAPAGTHPAELRMNSAVEGGDVVIFLNPVYATGKSSTEANTMTYSQLMAYDGFIQVLKNISEALDSSKIKIENFA